MLGAGSKPVRVHFSLQLTETVGQPFDVYLIADRQSEDFKVVLVEVHGSLNGKGFTATAFILHVRVLEFKAFIQTLLNVVHFGPVDIDQALRVNKQLRNPEKY